MNIQIPVLLLFAISSLCAETVHLSKNQSISEAMIKVRSGDTLALDSGVYNETIILKDKVTLIGAGNLATTIRGSGRHSVLTISGNSTVANLIISGGQNGIQTQSANAKITRTIITENRGSGILAIKALPEITNSVIYRNGGNGIQATMIGGGSLILDSLTIAENGGYGFELQGVVPVSVTHSLFYKNGLKAFRNQENQIVASQNVIFPEQKEFSTNNKFDKPEFKTEKSKRAYYDQTAESPGKGAGAVIH